jgi:hypothetical protein
MNQLHLSVAALFVLGCGTPATPSNSASPASSTAPWAANAWLDGRTTLVAALDPQVLVAYDAENGAYRYAWVGGVASDGATVSGLPRLVRSGRVTSEGDDRDAWELERNGASVPCTTQLRGFTLSNRVLTLKLALSEDGGESIEIEETVHILTSAEMDEWWNEGTMGQMKHWPGPRETVRVLCRQFTIHGAPKSVELLLHQLRSVESVTGTLGFERVPEAQVTEYTTANGILVDQMLLSPQIGSNPRTIEVIELR